MLGYTADLLQISDLHLHPQPVLHSQLALISVPIKPMASPIIITTTTTVLHCHKLTTLLSPIQDNVLLKLEPERQPWQQWHQPPSSVSRDSPPEHWEVGVRDPGAPDSQQDMARDLPHP